MNSKNRQVLLKSRPVGIPQAAHFEIVEAAIPQPSEGQILVRNHFLSVEPAMRGWVNSASNYEKPVEIGAVMRSFSAGIVERSNHPDYKAGDAVMGWFGWQEYAAIGADAVQRKITEKDLPLSTSLGVLGLNGITAYFGLREIGMPKSGDTVVVSTAAGSVGSCVGQLAKMMGCRTVGIAGGPQKVAQCKDLFGYDEAIDYKTGDLASALAAACPNGVNVYFDNTAGSISDAVYQQLAPAARVVICGTASVSNWNPPPAGPRVERVLLVKRARMQGFVVFEFEPRYAEALSYLANLIREGKLKFCEDILDGIEHAPDAIAGLYRGENLGKRLIRIA